jgi:hypothetical protein
MTMNKSRSSPIFFAGILLLLMLFGLIYQLWQARQEAIDMAKRASRSMAELLVTRVESDFARLDGVLSFAAGEFLPTKLAAMSTAERTAQSARLERLIIDFPAVAEAFVFDAEGQLVIASIPHQPPFNIVDRPKPETYHRFFRPAPDAFDRKDGNRAITGDPRYHRSFPRYRQCHLPSGNAFRTDCPDRGWSKRYGFATAHR